MIFKKQVPENFVLQVWRVFLPLKYPKQSDFLEDLRVKFVILQNSQFFTQQLGRMFFGQWASSMGKIANCQSLAFSELDQQTLEGHSAVLCGTTVSRMRANRAIGIATQ